MIHEYIRKLLIILQEWPYNFSKQTVEPLILRTVFKKVREHKYIQLSYKQVGSNKRVGYKHAERNRDTNMYVLCI